MYAVTTARGPSWDRSVDARHQKLWDEHAAYFDGLVERGLVVLGGPIGSPIGDGGDGSADEVALLAVEAAGEDEVSRLFSGDPWAGAQILVVKSVRPWTIWLDGRS